MKPERESKMIGQGDLMKRIAVSTCVFLFTNLSFAADPIAPAAVTQTQDQLRNPQKRIEILKNNPQGQKVDAQVQALMGQNSEEMYRTAADFLPYILQMGHGDPTKMAQFLTQASRDPASFAANLPPELKQKLAELTEKVKPLPEERKP